VSARSSTMSQLDRVWKQSRLSNTTKFCIYNSCVLSSLLYASETWTLLKVDITKLEAFYMTNQKLILGVLWYEFATNVEVATLSQLPYINETIVGGDTLFGHLRHMDRLLLPTKPYISQSRHDRAQSSLTPGGDNQVVRENAGWNRSPRARGLSISDAWSVATDQSAWRALRPVPSTVKRRERERESTIHEDISLPMILAVNRAESVTENRNRYRDILKNRNRHRRRY